MSWKKSRPDYGQPMEIGKRTIDLLTNHYHLEIPKCIVYHYDVKIERGRLVNGSFEAAKLKPQYNDNRSVMGLFIARNQGPGKLFHDDRSCRMIRPVFDGKQNLYTIRSVPHLGPDKNNFYFDYAKLDGNLLFRVKIKFAAEVDLTCLSDFVDNLKTASVNESYKKIPQDAIRALDIILRNGPANKGISVGGCIFPRIEETNTIDIGNGKCVVSGHYQTIRPTVSGLSLIVDKTSSSFYKACDLIDFIRILTKNIPSKSKGNFDPLVYISLTSNNTHLEENLRLIEKELAGLTIEVTHTPSKMKFKFRELTRSSARETTFRLITDESAREVSVADFFKEKYGIRLNYANFPCAVVGNIKRPSYLPLEVCQLVQNQVSKKLTQLEVKSFIKSCSHDCDQRFDAIKESVSTIKEDSKDYLEEFSIDLNCQPIEVEGVCLDVPKVSYRDGCFTPESGKWNLSDKKINRGFKISDRRWFVANFSSQNPVSVQLFVDKLTLFVKEKGSELGAPIYVDNGHPLRYDSRAVRDTLRRIYDQYEQRKIDRPHLILFIITRTKGDKIYQEIKQFGDVRYGFNTQCLVDTNLKTMAQDRGFFMLSNFFLKMNAKLGGINNLVIDDHSSIPVLGDESTMIIGADVTHPDDRMSYSIAACVGSVDRNQTQYLAAVRLQSQSREEIIQDFPDMVEELIIKRIDKSTPVNEDTLPKKLIIYRDGVSNGQFSMVIDQEIRKLRDHFDEITKKFKLHRSYEPKITFIVVQKRHHTRLRPKETFDGQNKNIPSGTLVAEKIVHTNDGSDFYLCSHSSSLGTSKPSHYFVLLDENNFSHYNLYRLTFNLCHIYVKSTRVISIPVPVQYAHLAAFRARQHLANGCHRSPFNDSEMERKEIEKSFQIHRRLASNFYFI